MGTMTTTVDQDWGPMDQEDRLEQGDHMDQEDRLVVFSPDPGQPITTTTGIDQDQPMEGGLGLSASLGAIKVPCRSNYKYVAFLFSV